MIRVLFACCLLVLVSCMEQGKKAEAVVQPILPVDTVRVVPEEESDTLIVAEEVISATADESFLDFFYNFASDEAFQRNRIVYPLPYYLKDEVQRFEKNDWNYDPLFSEEEMYTVLFDTEEEMELEKDTSAHSVQVDWIGFDSLLIKRYYFERKQNSWYLEAINLSKIEEPEENGEKFIDFYQRFVADSAFQEARLHDPVIFVTADPDDEFQMVETTLDEGQWFAFCPPLPKKDLTNIRYGQTNVPDSPVKILEIKGFGNGFSNVLHFQRREGIWKLMKFEDLSD